MRLDIDKIKLQAGGHQTPQDGLCVMEAVAYIAREQHSDHPECVSPVIAQFLRTWNDALSDADRQKLKALIPVVLDSRSTPEDETRRGWMCIDWLIRIYAPTWLRCAGINDQAASLESLSEIKDGSGVTRARPVIDAAETAAGAAAGVAARDAARVAARVAARAAAETAAGAAAWVAARDAARAAAETAAGAAAWAAAGVAAEVAAQAAARDALRPTVEQLQTSALDLVERMVWLKEDQ